MFAKKVKQEMVNEIAGGLLVYGIIMWYFLCMTFMYA